MSGMPTFLEIRLFSMRINHSEVGHVTGENFIPKIKIFSGIDQTNGNLSGSQIVEGS